MTPDFNVSNYVFLLILLLIIYLPVRIIFCACKKREYKVNFMREALLLVLTVYVYITTYRLVCPYFEVNFYDELKIIAYENNSFIPLEKILDAIGTMLAGDIGAGLGIILRPILIFIPIGFMLSLSFDALYKRVWLSVLCSFVYGLLIQIPQIFTLRGFAFDDALLYAVGSLLGVLILKAVEKFAHNKNKFQPIKK